MVLGRTSQDLECKHERRQIVVPIFYNVDPSDIRKQTGSFGKALAEHEKTRPLDKVRRWRSALAEVAGLSGWHLTGDRPEPEIIEKIVTTLSETLDRMSPSNSNNQELVGLGRRLEKIKSLLCLNRLDNLTLGIWGMGGIGKTTLAEAICNDVSTQFDACCFLANVGKESKNPGGIACLRDKLLSTILEEKELHIGINRRGSAFTSTRLRRKKVLLVLDDVSGLDELEVLELGYVFAPGSVVIITSRDKQVLRNTVDKIYHVEALNYEESLQLFSSYAFKQNFPVAQFGDLADRFVGYAQGNPLALKVLGSLLHRQSKVYWESALKKLKEDTDPSILNLLKTSFDGLDSIEKEIYLDVACFFNGYNTQDVTNILDSCFDFAGKAHCGISNLIDKCLLNTTKDELWMHELLVQFGRSIIRRVSKAAGNRSRIWTPKDAYHVLRNNTGTPAIQGLFLDMSQINLLHLPRNSFSKMPNLKYLNISCPKNYTGREPKLLIPEEGLESFPSKLSYLHWEGYASRSLPRDFNPQHLHTLSLPNSDIEQLWAEVRELVNLRTINLTHCKNLTKIPDLLLATNLEKLIASYCTSLIELPCLSHLRSLKKLEVYGCSNLKKFPEVPLHLTELNFSGTAIEEVPSSLGELESLESLSLSGCPITKFPQVPTNIKSLYLGKTYIEVVPSSIGHLSQLSNLYMNDCERLKNLPTSICKLKHLEILDFSNCSRLESFPEILEPMESLRKLDLSGTALKGFPSSLRFLVGLTELRLNDCRNLTSLPNSLCNLTSLRLLYLKHCPNLVYMPNIKSLWRLEADETALMRPPSSITHLEELSLSQCKKLQLGSFFSLSSVNTLCLRDSNISEIPESLGNLSNLSRLDLSKNDFERIPATIKGLSNLVELLLISCERLRSVRVLPPCLRKLDAHNCTSLQTVSKQPHFTPVDGPFSYQFSNCFNLDQDAYNNIEAHAQLMIQSVATKLVEAYCHSKMIHPTASIFSLPGSDISDWFIYKEMGSSITVQLQSEWWKSTFLGFALCIVVDFKDYQDWCQSRIGFEQCPGGFQPTIICKGNFKPKRGGDCYNFSCVWQIWNDNEPGDIRCDHMLFLYHNSIYRSAVQMVDKDYHNEVSFEFFGENHFCKVKRCGVRPLYANFSSGTRSRL